MKSLRPFSCWYIILQSDISWLESTKGLNIRTKVEINKLIVLVFIVNTFRCCHLTKKNSIRVSTYSPKNLGCFKKNLLLENHGENKILLRTGNLKAKRLKGFPNFICSTSCANKLITFFRIQNKNTVNDKNILFSLNTSFEKKRNSKI